MTPYDPMSNPRWVGDSAEENTERDRDLNEIAAELVDMRHAIDTFGSPGWAYIEKLITEQVEEHVRTLRTRAKSMEEIEHARGSLHALEWLRLLPRYIRSEHQRVTDILATPGDGS